MTLKRGTMKHVITIVIDEDGTVSGDLDHRVALSPIGTESTAESTTIDGQARSILEQALDACLLSDFAQGGP